MGSTAMNYDRKDRYYQKAKESGYKSRAAYKLIQLHEKFQIFKHGMRVVDLGCAPGSWLQVISEKIGPTGKVVGLDIEEVPPFGSKNIHFIRGDILEKENQEKILDRLGGLADLVVSDMAPHLTGIKFKDHYHSFELADSALAFCHSLLRSGGNFVVKIFPGEELDGFKKKLQSVFDKLKVHIPDATRKTSSEIYLVGLGFR